MSALRDILRRQATVDIPFPAPQRRPPSARMAPATPRELGLLNAAITRVLGVAAGGSCPRVFTTLGRHRRLFRAWLRFAFHLMPFGSLPRRDAELVILRVAVLCGSDYEWHQHAVLGQQAGLRPEEIAAIGAGPDGGSWNARDHALLRATDELVTDHVVGAQTWTSLEAQLDEPALVEFCLLVGNYVMVAGALNALGVVPERT